ncbi:MAG: hypothetical protein RL120_01710 [Gammaproteobacteria bacterium]
MNSAKLTKEEKEILKAFESGKYDSTLTPQRLKYLQEVADASTRKDKRINIRISGRDLESLQRKAMQEGVPYQTLVSSILHKYISGGLRDVAAEYHVHNSPETSDQIDS